MSWGYVAKRVTSGCALVLLVFTVANHALEWGLFGAFSKHAIAVVTIVGFVLVAKCLPTHEEIESQRRERRARRKP